jgi:hypothetical protein
MATPCFNLFTRVSGAGNPRTSAPNWARVTRSDVAVEDLARSCASATPRRAILRHIAAVSGIGLATALRLPGAEAKKKRSHHKHDKKPKKNAFCCLDVGKACNGKDTNCCSGICDGKKPKHGEKDKSRCAAHNDGGCQPDLDACILGVAIDRGTDGVCFQTTGRAGFCAGGTGACTSCQKDTDREALGFGPGSACVVCSLACPGATGTVCFSTAAP